MKFDNLEDGLEALDIIFLCSKIEQVGVFEFDLLALQFNYLDVLLLLFC